MLKLGNPIPMESPSSYVTEPYTMWLPTLLTPPPKVFTFLLCVFLFLTSIHLSPDQIVSVLSFHLPSLTSIARAFH